ncbi:MAG TPA: FkbM family methyltransferase, partial [Chthonomonadaceae bacterium]|nr:FkbM family methyltransferase [Chthonomonadaceae bacterium]
DTVIDVGANIGALTLCAASIVGPAGHVISIEAHPRTYRFLCGNVALNGAANVETHNLAMGEAERTVSFTDQRADEQNVVSGEARELRVRMRRLDQIPVADGPIELLKIDVEGYEKFVLEGAAGILGRTEAIYFESWERHFRRFGYGCAELFRDLEALGFQLVKVVDEARLVLLGSDRVSADCEDLLAVRDVARLASRAGLPVETASRVTCVTR